MPAQTRPQARSHPLRSSGFRQATESLENKEFRKVFGSNMAFFLAMGGQSIVRPWLAFELTGDKLDLGIVSVAMAIPMLILSPFGGVLADRMERRRLIVLAQGFAMASEALILGLILTGRLEFWHLVVTSGMMGCALPLIMPARSAIVVNIVGKTGLGPAMALNMAGVNVTRVLGPAMAGFLIPVIQVDGVYMLNISLYGLGLLTMVTVARMPPPHVAHPASVMHNLLEGFRYVGTNRLVLMLLLFGLVPMFLAMPFQNLLVVFSEEVWNVGPQGLGILHASSGVGAVLGSFWMAARAPDAGRQKMMMVSVMLFGTFLAIFCASPWFGPAVFLVFVANIFASTFSTLNNVAIQLVIPDSVRGRISSFLMMSVSVPLLGNLPVAAVAEEVGAPLAVGGAAVLAVFAALAFYLASPELRNLDEHVRDATSLHA
ncbi:MAG: MFS transporter [bacterium]|nr:MFS transporter [bacterium]